jgi:hypothetical protein
MRAILVRVGADQVYGKWNGPMDPKTRQFVFVPIWDGEHKVYLPDHARSYEEILAPLAVFASAHDVPDLRLPPSLLERKMHLDPDFSHLTYGDKSPRRGAGIVKLLPMDMLVFYAGLRSIKPPGRLVYALIGLFVIEEIVSAEDIPASRFHQNAHTRWTPISEQDVIVRGARGKSGRFDRCIPIGEWRDGAYRVRRDIEEAWGGLSVKNGFIQRSAVPPEFKNASKFASWISKQGVVLWERNN